MKRLALLIAVLVIGIAASGCWRRGAEPGNISAQELTPEKFTETRRTIIAYLECEECEEGQLEALVKLGPAALPGLVATLRAGPSQANREVLRRNLVATHRQLKEYEKTHANSKVSQSEEEYVKTYLENYVALYQVRAATALAAIGGPEARKALEEASQKPLREDVRAAIKSSLSKMK